MTILRKLSYSSLYFTQDPRQSDDGDYTCTLVNKYGNVSHTIKSQCVRYEGPQPPAIIPGQPGNHTVMPGLNISLECQLRVQAVTTPHTVTWYKHYQVNGSWTNGTDNTGVPYVVQLQSSTDQPPPLDDAVLQLTNVTEADSGLYTCKVKNQYGGDIGTGFVNVTKIGVTDIMPTIKKQQFG